MLVSAQGLPFTFLERLKSMGIRTVEINEEDNSWIINGLAVRPRRVIMPRGMSAQTRDTLCELGVQIVEIDYDKVQLNGGGIHCSTSPLVRDAAD